MEAKHRWSTWLSVISVIIAAASLGVSGYFASETRQVARQSNEIARESKQIQEATLRPILVFNLEEASFDKHYIKIVLKLTNRGPTTAVIKYARITQYEEGNVTVIIDGMKNVLIAPGNYRRHVYRIPRDNEVAVRGVDYPLRFDPYETLSRMGRMPLVVSYESQQLPGVPFAEDLVFTSLPWHDKSIIGVGD